MTATLNMTVARLAGRAAGHTGHGVTGLVDCGFERVSRLRRFDRHAAGCQIDLDVSCAIVFVDRVRDCSHTMLAAHAFYLEFDRHRDCLEKMNVAMIELCLPTRN
jgi:hypothetical protein